MKTYDDDGWPQNPQTGDTEDAATCTQCDADNTLVTYSHTEYPHGVQFWLCENCLVLMDLCNVSTLSALNFNRSRG